MKPFSRRPSRRSTLLVAVSLWLVSILLSLPYLLFYTVVRVQPADGGDDDEGGGDGREMCVGMWPETIGGRISLVGEDGTNYLQHGYDLFMMAVTYLAPLAVISLLYLIIGRKLWGTTSGGGSAGSAANGGHVNLAQNLTSEVINGRKKVSLTKLSLARLIFSFC